MEEYFYEVDLSMTSQNGGLINSHGMQQIEVTFPEVTKREKRYKWTSEHLLASALSSCYMNTFLDTAKKTGLEVMSYHSQCFLKMQNVKGKFVTTEILIRPFIKLKNDLDMLKGYKCIEEAEKISPIRNALKLNIEIHPQFEQSIKPAKVKV